MNQLPMGLNTEALDEWIEYRLTEHKKKMSDLAVKKCANRLSKHSLSHQQYMVDRAIECDWKGIHEVEPARVVSTRDRSIEDDLNDTSWAENIVRIN